MVIRDFHTFSHFQHFLLRRARNIQMLITALLLYVLTTLNETTRSVRIHSTKKFYDSSTRREVVVEVEKIIIFGVKFS